MIIGDSNIDYDVLKSFAGKPDDLVVYVENMVPSWARHIKCLAQNQRFYIAVHLRGVLTLPYQTRMELVNALVDGINVSGIISTFTSIREIVDMCDKKKLAEMIKQRLEDERK